MKLITNLFFKEKSCKKYTCNCCGYKTLLDQGSGEICPVCGWEEEYHNDDFLSSGANDCTLYEDQENYRQYGSSSPLRVLHCRMPNKSELYDTDWESAQDRIEKQYKDEKDLVVVINELITKLKFNNAKELYKNFKCLPEVLFIAGLLFVGGYSEFEWTDDTYQDQLLLNALAIYLKKINEEKLINLIVSFYEKGLDYYIGWTVLLLVAINKSILDRKCRNILLDIELNDFYGLDSLKKSLGQYWQKQK